MDRKTTDRYLQRIGYLRDRGRSAAALAALQEAHLRSVPFENLDIHWGRPIVLDEAVLADKVIARRRGGFCYELNGLFSRLLASLGYEVTLLSARVFGEEGALGPEHDHLALLVEMDGRWLVDVGFGDAFVTPLALDISETSVQRRREHRVTGDDEGFTYSSREEGEEWKPQYTFSLAPRELSTFEAMCMYHQTSPKSHFTQKRVISRLTSSGRITLRDERLIVTEGRSRRERSLTEAAEWRDALREHFGIEALG